MIRTLLLTVSLLLPYTSMAVDLANGERINKNCALCHGIFGQGATGRLSPRLAGLPEYYLRKSIADYISGKRTNPTMMKTSGLAHMSQQDIDDVTAYLASLKIARDQRFNILQSAPGNPENGEELYMDDCKTCHAKDGMGKENKDSPPLAGQHPEYLFQSIQMFKGKVREHADDPDDETFTDYSDQEVLDMLAFATTLDDSLVVAGERFMPPHLMAARPPEPIAPRPAPSGGLQITDITQTVAQMELKPGVTKEDAV